VKYNDGYSGNRHSGQGQPHSYRHDQSCYDQMGNSQLQDYGSTWCNYNATNQISGQLQGYYQADGELSLERTTADHSRKFVAGPVSYHASSFWNQKKKSKNYRRYNYA